MMASITISALTWITMMCIVSGLSLSMLRTATNSVTCPHHRRRLLSGRMHFQVLSMKSSSASDPSKPPLTSKISRRTRARDLIYSLVQEEQCFTRESGANHLSNVCAINVLYEDCYEPQPVVGRALVLNHLKEKVNLRQNRGSVRIDKISDGDLACGFSWTWTSGDQEGLRGTTFVKLNPVTTEIEYIREIPEPIYKPGDLTLQFLQAITKDAIIEQDLATNRSFTSRTPTVASDIARYLYEEVQGKSTSDEAIRFFSDDIIYRDFNYEEVMKGKSQVKKFIDDFSLPGISFVPQLFDDGVDSTCFTWEVKVLDAPQGIKGISFYELDTSTRMIRYVRDVPESAIKPPILGKLARIFRPGLGVFQGVGIGSRPEGM